MLRLIWCIRRGWRVKLVMTSPNCAINISHKMKPHSNMMTRHSSDMKICFALSNSGLFFEMRAYFPLQRSGMFKFNQKFVACTCQNYQKKSQNIQMQIWHISMGNNTTRENRKTTTKIKLQTKQTSSIFSFHLLNATKSNTSSSMLACSRSRWQSLNICCLLGVCFWCCVCRFCCFFRQLVRSCEVETHPAWH